MQALHNAKTSMVCFREHLEQFSASFARFGTTKLQLQELGLILESYDVETAQHSERVFCLATALGQALGLNDWQLEALQQGATLHDLGKVIVPNAILCKTTPLDAKEWAVMKTHVEYGYYFASKIAGLNPGALNVIRYHHERWDGTGYPLGLKAKHIPLEARIFAICDVYDALISERPYKRAWTQDQVVQQLRLESGKHFDTEVVEALIQHLTLASDNIFVPEINSHTRATGFESSIDFLNMPPTLAC
jgi:HD-GYP domain-containing protein (c-di-GMP phosphodiesterase class II)